MGAAADRLVEAGGTVSFSETHVALVLHADDTVAMALADLSAGREVTLDDGETVTLAEDVPFGHKFALRSMAADEDVRKYGEVIGIASTPIRAGD